MQEITPFHARLDGQIAPVNGGFTMEDYWVWCGSPVKDDDGKYHLFASRWPKKLMFDPGWLSDSEVVRASSDTPEGPYQFEEVVLRGRPGHWDSTTIHNPTIHRHGDTWVLFYTGTNIQKAIGAKIDGPPDTLISGETAGQLYLTKRIGIATAPSLTGPWTRRDAPILEVRPDMWDCDITSNAAVSIRPDGSTVLLYKSSRHRVAKTDSPFEKIEGAPLKLGVAVAKHWAGPYERPSETPLEFNGPETDIEDPYLWWQDDHYEAIFKDMTGDISGSYHGGIHAWSKDGIDWKLAEAPLAYTREIHWSDGSHTTQGQFERPQLLIQDGKPTHLFAATGDGIGGFDKMTKTWNMVIPLK